MNLANPDVGDILDRMTILHLKLVYGGERAHWGEELSALSTMVGKLDGNKVGPCFGTILRLAATNAALWAAEDDLRAMRFQENKLPDAGALALRIQDWNDKRTRLIASLNEKLGRGAVQEKVIP